MTALFFLNHHTYLFSELSVSEVEREALVTRVKHILASSVDRRQILMSKGDSRAVWVRNCGFCYFIFSLYFVQRCYDLITNISILPWRTK